MSVVLSIYSQYAYKEYVLPAVRNEETILVIERGTFRLSRDVELRLENIDGRWIVRGAAGAHIVSKGYNTLDRKLVNGANYLITTSEQDELWVIVTEKETSFVCYKKYSLHGLTEITVGSSTDNMIEYSYTYRDAEFISHNMMSLRPHGNYADIVDLGRNGVFLNDQRITGSATAQFGDHIHIWGLDMIFLGDVIAIRETANCRVNTNVLPLWKYTYAKPLVKSQPYEKEIYHRSPRNIEKLEVDPVEIEAPPQPRSIENMPLLMIIGPALTMAIPMAISSGIAIISSRSTGAGSGAFMYTGIITALCSAVIGAFWAIMNLRNNKLRVEQAEKHRFDAYSNYLKNKEKEIQKKYGENVNAMIRMYPSASDCVSQEMREQNLLWCRNSSHEDFLNYRLGLGNRPFQVDIQIPKERFTLIDDSLAERPKQIRDIYATLRGVPVGVDLLSNRIVGVVGGKEKRGAYEVLYALVAQIASQNCYTDVKLCFVYEEDQGDDVNHWEFARWLPHVWSQDKKVRFIASSRSSASDAFYELGKILRDRMDALESHTENKAKLYKPHYVVFIEDSTLLEGELIARYIYGETPDIGATFILLAESYENLPNTCECIIQNDNDFHGIINVRTSERASIEFDAVNVEQLEAFARDTSNLEVLETETGGDIPGGITFFDMYGVNTLSELHVAERWKKNRTYMTMKALVGQMAGGKPCYLDVHEKYHGPHGLVAGTTGSGKSETLQTYMLSLALNFSPDDIGFFIIDYKGGGMANLFNGLPHLLGSISNLSGNQVRRAMVSIKSENRRRQRVFTENGVNNINAYTQLYKSGEVSLPVPHLFIIIDEFAELKREEGDFMKELISVAQVGRSLGVHLILATQKPSGTVDDNIWSNSKFRLCLRVQDKQDSMDMLHKADAAYLTQAGRCYMQVGNDELYQLFQSGYSGATYDEDAGSQKQVVATMLADSGKAALVGSHVKKKQKEAKKNRWFGRLISYADSGISSAQDSENADFSILDYIMGKLAEDNIDYPDNDYNRRLLDNFLLLYNRLTDAATSKERAKEIIRIAEVEGVKLPEQKDKTQLDAVIEYLASVALAEGYRPPQKLWLPVLPVVIPLERLEGTGSRVFDGVVWPDHSDKWHLQAPIGLCDDPENQLQMPQVIDFTESGNHAILGIAMSGKSTLMQTVLFGLASRYSPEYLSIYIIDFSNRMLSCFEALPHCGGALYESDVETVGKFFRMLRKMIDDRKKLFQGGNYSQYVMTHGVEVPAVLVVLDNIANFREKTETRFDDDLIQITRECAAYGIYFLISGAGFNATEVPTRMRDNLHGTICLEMMDKFQYSDALNTMQVGVVPETGIHGRGLTVIEGRTLEFQACIAVDSVDDYQRSDMLRKFSEEMLSAWAGKRAVPIPKIPENPTWEDFELREDVQEFYGDDRHIPIGFNSESADIYAIDLSAIYTYMIQGKAGTGKKNLLKLIGLAAQKRQARMIVIEIGSNEMFRFADSIQAKYVRDYAEFRAFMLDDFIPLFKSRNVIKKDCVLKGMESAEIYSRMSEEQEVYILISNMDAFVSMLYSKESTTDNLNGGFANLVDKGSLHNIYMFATMTTDTRSSMLGKDVFEKFVRGKVGIHMGGGISQQRLFDFSGMSMSEQSAIEKAGTGVVPPNGNAPCCRVVTPLVKVKKA